MMEKLREGNHFANKWQFVVTFKHGTCLHIISINWAFSWFPWRSTFMSHVTPLNLSKEFIVHCRIMSLSRLVMLPSLLSCRPMFKGKLKKFTSTVRTISVSILLSQSCGYYIHIIPELCSKFRAFNVGLIMALLRWDYSHWHHLIIQVSLRNKNLVPWDLYDLMIYSLTLDIGSNHWPLINRIDSVFDIRKSIHT